MLRAVRACGSVNWKWPAETSVAVPNVVQLENARPRLVVENTVLVEPAVCRKLN